jgi:hypothetical protein
MTIPALHVTYHRFLESEGGGVQAATREYVAALEAAGFNLHTLTYDFTRDLATRVRRRVLPEVWYREDPPKIYEQIDKVVREQKVEFVFFGHTMFSGLSRRIKQAFPGLRQVLLSHGAEGFDFAIEQQMRRNSGSENRFRFVAERMLGRVLLDQMEQRRLIDAVLTLSPLEVDIERWLGCSNVLWVPRTITEPPLDLKPVDQRVGCVSTLDHAPNHQGLLDLFDALAPGVPPSFRFRLVGGPVARGKMLASRYPFVEYMGPLSDAELRVEAATWCCFVHPMFVYAKGCSTKLAVGIGWDLPIATTEYGARGYRWDRRVLPLADSPASLAELLMQRAKTDGFERHRVETRHIAASTPKMTDVGRDIRRFLTVDTSPGRKLPTGVGAP